jgi:hypothetical protein
MQGKKYQPARIITNMEITQDQVQFLVNAAIQSAEEQKKSAEEQTRFANEQRIANSIQAAEFKIYVDEQKKFNKVISEKLDNIERHVILIHGNVVSDFHGIQPDTKKTIEEVAEVIVLTEDEIETHERLLAPTNKTKEAVLYRKQIAYYSAAKELRTYGKALTKGEAISVGNWTSGIVTKMLGKNFKGKYPLKLRPLVSSLVGYYAVERESERMY